ncbi:TonB-dependent receptor [Phenylobacterium sp.]|jgi:iron complex outermembrane receptor protein|uniref:TonB-dependent receptor n=1 Tax=Phenylobacterium sp. TaxID=1871053 RepID=UPI002F3E632D
MKHSHFCGGSALVLAASLFSVQAYAQSAPAKAAAADAATTTTLSDLVVVAQKREEKLESVPVAVTAFSAEQRTLVGIESVQDLTNFTPGFSYNANTDRPYMRGIGRNTDNLAVASAVATYYNGVYDGANATILLQHSDLFISTVEIDRGPQNTLHGANADGGSINYTSQKPTKDYYAEGRVGVANNQRYWGEAVVSGPINDWLRFRLGGNVTQENGGYFKNLDGPRQGGGLPQLGAGQSQYWEAQLDANLGEHLDAWAMASSGRFEADYHQLANRASIPNNYQLNGAFSPSNFFGLCGLPGVATSPGGAAGCTGATALGQSVVPGSVTGGPVFANAFPGNNPTIGDPRTFIQEATSTNKQHGDIALATNLTYHFPSFDLTYLGGYQKFNYVLNFTGYADSGVTSYQLAGQPAGTVGLCELDAAGGGYSAAACSQPLTIHAPPTTTFFQENDAFFSHEIDLTSTDQSPLQWIAGAYYYHEAYDQPVDAGVQPNQPQFAHPDLLNLATGALTPAPVNPMSAASTSDTRLLYDSVAAFGHIDYKFSDEWKAHVGVRYTYDHKFGEQFWRFEQFAVPLGGGTTFMPSNFGAATPALDITSLAAAASLGVSFPGAGPASINPATGFAHRLLNAQWNAWTGDLGVDWTPDANTLVYAKYSRGYKAGGFTTFTIGANPETGLETVDAYEIGLKKTFANQFRLNAAIFYDNYKNDQIPLNVQNAQGLISAQLFNLKDVHISGEELEATWQPNDAFVLSAQYAHLDAEVNDAGACFEDTVDPAAALPGANTSGCNNAVGATAVTQNLKGEKLPESPPNKVSVNAIYTWQFDPGKLALSGTYVWKDATYGGLFNRSYDLAPAYTQVNLRAVWTDAKNRYNVIGYVNNVFDSNGFDGAVGALVAPGNIGTSFSLLNPRTFGVEFRYRWQ